MRTASADATAERLRGVKLKPPMAFGPPCRTRSELTYAIAKVARALCGDGSVRDAKDEYAFLFAARGPDDFHNVNDLCVGGFDRFMEVYLQSVDAHTLDDVKKIFAV